MSHFQITLDDTLLQQLFQNDGLKPLLEQVLNQALVAQVTEVIGAAPHERTEERANYRNGYRQRELTTRIGSLTLRVPKLRQGTFTPDLFERYQRSEMALLSCLVEMVVQGVSTRKVSSVVQELCGEEVSKSTVSALCQRLDPQVKAWRERSLSQTVYPFVIVDALVIRVRQEDGVRPQSLLVATSVTQEGYREILGFFLGDSESEGSWSAFFSSLKDRGLSGVDLVVSDNHKGLVQAVRRHFQGVRWQQCQTHLTRNVLSACPNKERTALHKRLRALCEAETPDAARGVHNEILASFGKSAPNACDCLEAAFEDAIAVLHLPEKYRKRLRTTNSQERLNEEIRRRERVIRIFPNATSAERLLGALLMECDEAFTTGHRYLDMTDYWEWKQQQHKPTETERKAA
jgi:transposase-like protein